MQGLVPRRRPCDSVRRLGAAFGHRRQLDFDAAVLRAADIGVVRGDRIGRTKALRGDACRADAIALEIVGDRVGATSSESSEFAGIPLPVLLIGAAVIVATIAVASNDDSESD